MRNLLAVALVAVGWSSPADAQSAAYFEVGGARVRYGDTAAVSAGTASVAATARTPRTSFSGFLAGSRIQESPWTVFGAVDGSIFTPGYRALKGELHAAGSGISSGSSTGSARFLGGARLHAAAARFGTWLGVSAGTVVDPIGSRGFRQGELGLWTQLGAVVAQVVVSPVRIADDIEFTDTEATLRFGASRVELAAGGGFRSQSRGSDEFPNTWASVNATAWVLNRVGITGGVGSYPADLGQGLPAAKYVSLGIRVAPRRIVPPLLPLPSESSARAMGHAATAITVSNERAGRRTISLQGLSAQRVEIMGDFTDWAPVQMSPSTGPGAWEISLPVSSGVHQINVRIDGGEWIVPAGLTSVRDEFGGSVGVVVVP